ncbi:MAG: tetratricopeptide repeat protein, partial [Planctomycetes bacterium]|nr:tetratricopeptide repeat protein [Planctomycetota bacterium]
GRFAEALALAERAAAQSAPPPARVLAAVGLYQGHLERYQEALESLSAALELDPNRADWLSTRANTWRMLGEPAKALADCDRALALMPGLLSAAANRAEALMALERYPEAAELYTRLLAEDPTDVRFYTRRAECYRRLERFSEQVLDLDRALELEPSAARYEARGKTRLRLDDTLGAIEDFEQALKLGPGGAGLFSNLGCALFQAGRLPEAVGCLDAAIDLDPAAPESYLFRGLSHAGLGHYPEALADYDSALARDLAPQQRARVEALRSAAAAAAASE